MKKCSLNFRVLHRSSATKSLISDLSNHPISKTEKTVLEVGLTFCPSQKNLNKEQLHITLDFYHFIHRLKLKEYFHFNPPHTCNNQNNPENHVTTDDERSKLNWSNKNADWYPDVCMYVCMYEWLNWLGCWSAIQ